jgi:hypothetical protein
MNSITIDGVIGSGELWLDIVRIIIGDISSRKYIDLCDLMCHKAPYTSQLNFTDSVFVDVQYRGLEIDKDKRFTFVCDDVLHFFVINNRKFDVTICSDGIEHLPKKDAYMLLGHMEGYSAKQIIFTPLGDASITKDGHPDSHASGWMPEDFPEWLTIVLPSFHSAINIGAFFAVRCSDEEKQRIHNEIKQKYVESRID